VAGLDRLAVNSAGNLEIGALATLSRVRQLVTASRHWGAFRDALDQLTPPQVHNTGTVVGNICAAVPYYDLPTALVALGAKLRIVGAEGERLLPLADFYVASGTTALRRDELVASIIVPPSPVDAGSAFAKILKAARRASDLHKVNAAGRLVIDAESGRIGEAAIVIGSCGFRPWRAPGAEARLIGAVAGESVFEAAAAAAADAVERLTDVPWVEAARRGFVRALVGDILNLAAQRARQQDGSAA
jgi:CO/xanthine dehydrogenase FAD-binding subunit